MDNVAIDNPLVLPRISSSLSPFGSYPGTEFFKLVSLGIYMDPVCTEEKYSGVGKTSSNFSGTFP